MRAVEMEGPGGGWLVLLPGTRRERMRGLRGHPPPGPREAMLFQRCRTVHTFGMKAAIAVAFLDRGLRVIRIRRLPPGRLLLPVRGARHVLECGVAERIAVGDRFGLRVPAAR